MLFSVSEKKILVTGAAGHLGRALSGYLVANGATVYAVDRDREGLDRLKLETPPVSRNAMLPIAADLASEVDRTRAVRAVCDHTDSLDGVVFAAAFVGTSELEGWSVPFQDQHLDAWRLAIELNLTAPFHLTQLLEPLLRGGTDPSIVNIGSIYASMAPDWSLYDDLALSNPAAYSASKAGLRQLTKWLATLLAPDIRVNMVSPGGILRDQPEEFVTRYSARTPLGRMAEEQDVVGQVVNLLSASSSYITGQDIVVDGGVGL